MGGQAVGRSASWRTFKLMVAQHLYNWEIFRNRLDAIKREKELKSFRGREFIRNIINNTRR
ncbi:MAG: hypothetical protein AAB397_04090 [Patescibacteria group bacterium]